MPYNKTFNRSERAALLALGELYKQNLVGPEVFDFQAMSASYLMTTEENNTSWSTRTVYFRKEHLAIAVALRTLKPKGPSEETREEGVIWEATNAGIIERGDVVKTFTRTKHPDHVHWARANW